MAEAGADIVVCHMGLTTGGAIGARDGADARRLRAADRRAGRRPRARCNRDVIVLCHGGPIATPDDAALHPGALPATATASTARSSMERLPTETALDRDHAAHSSRYRTIRRKEDAP